MSDFQAIGAVSNSLQTLLRDRMDLPAGVAAAPVTVSTPLSEEQGGPPVGLARVNLFLYRVTEDGALKNQELPGQGHPAIYGSPPLSLELHYLLTAYGSSAAADDALVDETTAQLLLGSAMRVLHDVPVIHDRLRTRRAPANQPILQPSLVGAYEQIKVTLEPLNLDQLTQVWTALTLPYRLSASYLVSVVQIDSRRQRSLAIPVQDLPRDVAPRVFPVPFELPQITDLAPLMAEIDETITLRGANLGRAAEVRLADHSFAVTPTNTGRIDFTIPTELWDAASPLPASRRLHLGPRTVQVVAPVPDLAALNSTSNVVPVVLVPRIEAVAPGAATAGATITVDVTPPVHRDDAAQLYVGDRGVPAEPLPAGTASASSLDFVLPTAADERIPPRAEPYPVRLRVNGAESRYRLIGDPPTPQWTLEVTP